MTSNKEQLTSNSAPWFRGSTRLTAAMGVVLASVLVGIWKTYHMACHHTVQVSSLGYHNDAAKAIIILLSQLCCVFVGVNKVKGSKQRAFMPRRILGYHFIQNWVHQAYTNMWVLSSVVLNSFIWNWPLLKQTNYFCEPSRTHPKL